MNRVIPSIGAVLLLLLLAGCSSNATTGVDETMNVDEAKALTHAVETRIADAVPEEYVISVAAERAPAQ